MNPRALLVFVAGLSLAHAALEACAAAPVVKLVDGALQTVCTDAAGPSEAPVVRFTCDVVDATGIVVNTFSVDVPPSSAPAFRAMHARPRADGGT